MSKSNLLMSTLPDDIDRYKLDADTESSRKKTYVSFTNVSNIALCMRKNGSISELVDGTSFLLMNSKAMMECPTVNSVIKRYSNGTIALEDIWNREDFVCSYLADLLSSVTYGKLSVESAMKILKAFDAKEYGSNNKLYDELSADDTELYDYFMSPENKYYGFGLVYAYLSVEEVTPQDLSEIASEVLEPFNKFKFKNVQ